MNAQLARDYHRRNLDARIVGAINLVMAHIREEARDVKRHRNLSTYAHTNFSERADKARFIREAKRELRKLGFKVVPVPVIDASHGNWFEWEVRW